MTGPRIIDVTPSQRDVAAELAADGASDQDIAERLGLTYGTVRQHVHGLLVATGCANRTHLAVALLRGRIRLRARDRRRDAA